MSDGYFRLYRNTNNGTIGGISIKVRTSATAEYYNTIHSYSDDTLIEKWMFDSDAYMLVTDGYSTQYNDYIVTIYPKNGTQFDTTTSDNDILTTLGTEFLDVVRLNNQTTKYGSIDFSTGTITSKTEDNIEITLGSGSHFGDRFYRMCFNTKDKAFSLAETTPVIIAPFNDNLIIPIATTPPTPIAYTVTATIENVTADTSNPETVEENTDFTLKYTAVDGYEITTATANIGTVTVSSDKTTATITGTATDNITVNVAATEIVVYRTLTENLTNATASAGNTQFPIKNGESFALYYDADTDYLISSCESNIGTTHINTNKKSCSVYGSATDNVVVTVKAVKEIVTYTVSATLSHVVASMDNPATVNEGEQFTLIYTADTGYYIDSATANIGNVVINDDRSGVTITGTATENIVITVTGALNDFKYTVGTLANCTCNKATGDTVKKGDVITITANNGYYFAGTAYTYVINTIVYQFTKSADNLTLTATIDTLADVTIKDVIATLIPVITASHFLHIYTPTQSELNDLSKARFADLDSGGYIDYGDNIIQLYRCYVPIPDESKSEDNIILGKVSTNIKTTGINNNVIDVETEITTTGLYYDTEYRATLYIPNYDTGIAVDMSHVFNKTMTIKLRYELYSNKCQYSLYDNGIIFDCGTFTFGGNIPFRFYEYNTTTDYNYNPPMFTHCVLVIDGENIINVADATTEYINGTLLDLDTTDIPTNDIDEINDIFTRGVYV